MSAQLQVTISVYEDGKFASEVNVKAEMCSIENAREVQLELADSVSGCFRELLQRPVEDGTA